MKLPVIRSLTEYIEERDAADITKTIEVLEHVSQIRGLKDEEINFIGELLSNLSGSLEVSRRMTAGESKTEALNGFMQRVLGSIDN